MFLSCQISIDFRATWQRDIPQKKWKKLQISYLTKAHCICTHQGRRLSLLLFPSPPCFAPLVSPWPVVFLWNLHASLVLIGCLCLHIILFGYGWWSSSRCFGSPSLSLRTIIYFVGLPGGVGIGQNLSWTSHHQSPYVN